VPKSQLSGLNLPHLPMFSTPETSVHVLDKTVKSVGYRERKVMGERIWRKGEF